MADDGVWIKNVDIQAKAGTNANSTAKATAATDVYVLEVEALINAVTRHNWSDEFSSLSGDVKDLLKLAGSNLAAIYVIQWDMSGFTSRIEAEDMVNILRDQALFALSLLANQEVKTFMIGATV